MSKETDSLPTPPTHLEVPLSQEELAIGKRQVEAGQVRLRKTVRTESQQVPVELRHEDIEVERVAPDQAQVPDNAFQQQEIDVPLMREEPVVSREARVTGQVQVNKNIGREQRTVSDSVRSEDVEIDQTGVDEYVHTPDER